MARTWQKGPLRLYDPSNSFLSLLERRVPEGASQTFVTHSPLKLTSGLAVEWTSGTDVAYFAAGDGQNTTGAFANVYMMDPRIEFEASFLGSAAADNVLAAADLGIARDLVKGTSLLGTGKDGWYIADTAVTGHCRITAFEAENADFASQSWPATGDTNARVRAKILGNLNHWFD